MNLGVRSGDAPEAAHGNRAALHAALATPHAPRWLHQVHGIEVARFDAAPAQGEEPVADAAVTDVPGLPLAIHAATAIATASGV